MFARPPGQCPAGRRLGIYVSLATLMLGLATAEPASAAGDGSTKAKRCSAEKVRHQGPGTVTGLHVAGRSCAAGRRLVRRYQRCLARGGDRRCYGRARSRCVQPVFLGGCRLRERLLPRRVAGYRCAEQRRFEIRAQYEAHVDCHDGQRRVSHDFTLFSSASVDVGTEREFRAAWANPRLTAIELTHDVSLRACRIGDPIRESVGPIRLDGNGHTVTQTCFEKRLLRQDGTGFVVIQDVTLTRGGSEGPGAAVTTRGEIRVVDSRILKNLAEEPGGGIFSMRAATIVRSVITGNLANDDGGGVYARRGGIRVFDSVISSNLVDGSGGALASTGDILVVRSHVDGNTTDGDGGALYADEDGDVTVVDSTVDGNTADGPGGAIFTLDGDVTVIGSTLNGNRADDRGGAISGESDVTVIGSTIARNAAVAHVGGGVWARGDLFVANSTISDNYAEGQGGGIQGAGDVGLVYATIVDNVAPVAANVGAGERLKVFGTIIGPPKVDFLGGQVQPAGANCRVSKVASSGHNFVTDQSCRLTGAGDVVGPGGPLLGPLRENGGIGETRLPDVLSLVRDRIPAGSCRFAPFGEALEGEQHLEGVVAQPFAPIVSDQRGVARPQGAGCDIGAVEAGP